MIVYVFSGQRQNIWTDNCCKENEKCLYVKVKCKTSLSALFNQQHIELSRVYLNVQIYGTVTLSSFSFYVSITFILGHDECKIVLTVNERKHRQDVFARHQFRIYSVGWSLRNLQQKNTSRNLIMLVGVERVCQTWY